MLKKTTKQTLFDSLYEKALPRLLEILNDLEVQSVVLDLQSEHSVNVCLIKEGELMVETIGHNGKVNRLDFAPLCLIGNFHKLYNSLSYEDLYRILNATLKLIEHSVIEYDKINNSLILSNKIQLTHRKQILIEKIS